MFHSKQIAKKYYSGELTKYKICMLKVIFTLNYEKTNLNHCSKKDHILCILNEKI